MMIVLLILLLLLLALILWIIFVPVYLRVDTALNEYVVTQRGTVLFSLHPGEPKFVRIRICGLPVPLSSGKKPQQKKQKELKPPEKKKKRTPRKPPEAWWFLVKGIFRSLKISKLHVTVDFDDVVLEAQLIPLMMAINRGVVQVNTNRSGHHRLNLHIEGRINRLLWALFRFWIKK